MKKTILSLGALISLGSPLTAVISCGNDKEDKKPETINFVEILKKEIQDKNEKYQALFNALVDAKKLSSEFKLDDVMKVLNPIFVLFKIKDKDIEAIKKTIVIGIVNVKEGKVNFSILDSSFTIEGFRQVRTFEEFKKSTLNDLNDYKTLLDSLIDSTKLNSEITIDEVFNKIKTIKDFKWLNDIDKEKVKTSIVIDASTTGTLKIKLKDESDINYGNFELKGFKKDI